MSRAIKFRAWKYRSGKMYEVTNMLFKDNWLGVNGSDSIGINYFGSDTEEEEYALMQFTGLLDKNGKEIYESDLFDAWNGRSKYVVEWQEAHACFKLVWVSGDVGDSKVRHYFDMYMAEYQFEPVGNIYENSELLKGE